MKDQNEFWHELLRQAIRESPGSERKKSNAAFSARGAFHCFRQYNRARLERLRRALGPQKCRILDVLPLIIHQPVPGAPAGDKPGRGGFGIVNFEPGPEMRPAVESMFPKYSWRPGALVGRPVVRSLLAMGSAGTVAQSESSDLDLWVIYDEQLVATSEEKRLLERLSEIERWVVANGLEMHFFPMSAGQVRHGDFGRIGGERSGSAMRALLKEEFYRTHLLLQGQVPRWWLKPPRLGADESTGGVFDLAGFAEEDFVDLGDPAPVSREELLGACLWQMVKALNKPFKSFLKLAVLERALRWPEAPLLCELLKFRLNSGPGEDPLRTDPYFMMADCLVEEFAGRGRVEVAELLSRCFYLQLAAYSCPVSMEAERRRLLSRLCEIWNWSSSEQAFLDNFQKWSLVEIIELGRRIFEHMNALFDELSQQARAGEKVLIDPTDMKLLERKLTASRALLSRQVPLLPVAFFSGSLQQSWIRFQKTQEGWEIRTSAWEGAGQNLPGSFSDLLMAGAFAVVNGIYGPATAVSVVGESGNALNSFQMRQQMARIYRNFGNIRPERLALEDFERSLHPLRLLVELSAREKPPSDGRTKLISEQWDLLEYGEDRICLIREIHLWICTNWGALLLRKYSGADGLPVALVECLQQLLKNPHAVLEIASSLEHSENSAAAKRVEVLLRRLTSSAREEIDDDCGSYFLTAIGGDNWMLETRRGQVSLLGPLGRQHLNELLGQVGPDRRLVVDPASLRWSALRWACERRRPEEEEVFLFPRESPSGVVFGGRGEIFLEYEGVENILLALVQVGGEGRIRSCSVQAENGRYVECYPPQAQMPEPHLEVEIPADGSVRYFLPGEENAFSLKQALIKLLSRLSPGEEKNLQIAFKSETGEFPMGLVERLVLRRKIIERSTRLIKILTESK